MRRQRARDGAPPETAAAETAAAEIANPGIAAKVLYGRRLMPADLDAGVAGQNAHAQLPVCYVVRGLGVLVLRPQRYQQLRQYHHRSDHPLLHRQ